MRGFAIASYLVIVGLILYVALAAPIYKGATTFSASSFANRDIAVSRMKAVKALTMFGQPYREAGMVARTHPIVGAANREPRRLRLYALSRFELTRILSKTKHQSPQRVGAYSQFVQQVLGAMHGVHRALPFFTTKQQGFTVSRPSMSMPNVLPPVAGSPQPGVYTGINHWWSYEEDALGGIGKYMINVASGNLIVQADDMAVPNKGVELAYRRTYNSESSYSYANTDGEGADLYGDNWTNTFDAHLVKNLISGSYACGTQQGITIYDIDGARYDYSPAGDCQTWIPPAGEFAQLYTDTSGDIDWLKPNGTRYVFEPPGQTGANAGRSGLIDWIYGRNNNNYLEFNRSWTNGDASNRRNLAQLQVVAEDGRTVTLQFADFTGSGQTFRLLQSLTYPDGSTTVTYGYQIYQNSSNAYYPVLTSVTEPSDGAVSGLPVQGYSYWAGVPLLAGAHSPNYMANGLGANTEFGYNEQVVNVLYFGDVNPEPADSTATYLQPGMTQDFGVSSAYRTVSLSYPANNQPGTTNWSDTDGHHTGYTWDSIGRVTQTADTTGDPSPGPATLTSTQSWDANNDLVASVDPRGFETDYDVDSSGNTVAVAQPAPSPGAARPTSYYSYDSDFNVTAYCDPVESNSAGKNWGSTPPPASDTLCSSSNGFSKLSTFTYAYPSYEPFGEIQRMTRPLGYVTTFSYSASAQGGADYGLPTSVTGTSFTQFDNSQMTPGQQFYYDASGNLICYSKDDGHSWWTLQYDSGMLGRVLKLADPDDDPTVSGVSQAACPAKSPGLPGSSIVQTKTYFADGMLASAQSPDNLAAGVATTYTYDADGNELSEQHYYGGTPSSPPPTGVTTKWYDGADRLVEVKLPTDPRGIPQPSPEAGTPVPIEPATPNLTRYIYDLTQNNTIGQATVAGTSVSAHGNLFKTDQYLPTGGVIPALNAASSPKSWMDTKGNAFDDMDRAVAAYAYPPGSASMTVTTSTYDSAGLYGLLSAECNGAGECASRLYDGMGRVVKTTYTGGVGTPTQTTTYDPDSRVGTAATAVVGAYTYAYDADGNLKSATEPAAVLTSPATLTYDYYQNGLREDLSVASSGLSQTNIFQFAYRNDGSLAHERFNHFSDGARDFTWSRTPAGRPQAMTDPYFASPAPEERWTYDGYGRASAYYIAGGTSPPYSYGDEGELIGLESSASENYTIRDIALNGTVGEPAQQTIYDILNPVNGNGCAPPCGIGPADPNIDVREGVSLGVPLSQSPYQEFTFDAAGRETDENFQAEYMWGKVLYKTSGNFTRSYDAENHIVAQVDNGMQYPQCVINHVCQVWVRSAYVWGPNGHPVQIGSTPALTTDDPTPGPSPTPTTPPVSQIKYDSLHWDGGSLLFTTNSSGVVDDIKVGTIGDLTPLDPNYSGFTVQPRDINRVQSQGMTNSHGYYANDTADDWHFCRQPGPAGYPKTLADGTCYPNVGHGLLLSDTRVDGFNDGGITIQGARSYDSDLQAWTTPDAFQGVADDPMSQHPYMWNRDNPAEYNDPSGFAPLLVDYDSWPDSSDFSDPFATAAPSPTATSLARAVKLASEFAATSPCNVPQSDVSGFELPASYFSGVYQMGVEYGNLASSYQQPVAEAILASIEMNLFTGNGMFNIQNYNLHDEKLRKAGNLQLGFFNAGAHQAGVLTDIADWYYAFKNGHPGEAPGDVRLKNQGQSDAEKDC